MPPSLHAVLGASSAHRWLACTPSARLAERMEERFGKRETSYAREGTIAHELGELKIRNAVYHADEMTAAKLAQMPEDEREQYIGINDFRYQTLRGELGEIPEDVEKATDSYCDVVMQKFFAARERDPGTKLLLEQKLSYARWVPHGFGTGDCLIISDSLLEVIDYKNGVGIPVNAVGNPQVRLYGLGAYDTFHLLFDFDKVRVTIVQPRIDNLTEETLSVADLLAWAEEEVVEKAKLAWAGEGDFVPGDHCRFCAAKAICAARVAEALKLFRYGFEQPGLLSNEQIPEILSTLDVAESWMKDFREYVEGQAIRGQRFPGFKLVRGKRPNRAWKSADEVKAQLLRAGYPASTFEVKALKPPGEMEKMLGKPAFRALLGDLVSQGEGRLILVPESDKRVEYSSADAAFADLAEAQEIESD